MQGGKYRIERVLGQGGYGITYEGLQTGLNRRVAIKEFFLKEYCEREGQTSHVTSGTTTASEIVAKCREKFIKEAQMIASFDRAPHIVRIYDIFEENGTAYYVMEYVEGGSLTSLVEKSGPLPVSRAINLIRQTGQALSYLHSRQTMHLDVKPANLLLRREDDGSDNVVLIDFGISKHYDAQGHATTTSFVTYSRGFASLEQYREGGVQEFSPTSDIYSLGATLYFLLTGQTPPDAMLLVEDPLERPSTINPDLWQIISRAMSTSRRKRYQTVDEMMQALNSLKLLEKAIPEKEVRPIEIRSNTPNTDHLLRSEPKNEETKVLSGNTEETRILSKKGLEVGTPHKRIEPLSSKTTTSGKKVVASSTPMKPKINKPVTYSNKKNVGITSDQNDESTVDVIRNGIFEIYRENPVSISISIVATIILFIVYAISFGAGNVIIFFIIGFLISTIAQIAFQISMYNAGQSGWGRLIPGILMGVASAGVLLYARSIGQSSEEFYVFNYISVGGLIPVVSITGVDLIVSFIIGLKDSFS